MVKEHVCNARTSTQPKPRVSLLSVSFARRSQTSTDTRCKFPQNCSTKMEKSPQYKKFLRNQIKFLVIFL